MIHRALAEYYIPETLKKRKRGPHPAKTFKKIYEMMDANGRRFNVRVDDEFWIDAKDLGVEMMENYVDQWRDEDEDILVLYPEMPFQFDILDPDTGQYLCTYVGTTDCLVKRISTKQVGLLEHKTAASIDTGHLFMDEQASTYWAIIPEWLRRNEIFQREFEFSFMLYNYLRKAQKDTRPQKDGVYLNQPDKKDLLAAVAQYKIDPGVPVSKLKKEDLEELLRGKGLDPEMFGQPSKSQPPPLFHRETIMRGDVERSMTMERIIDHVRDMNAVRAGEMKHYKAPSKECKWCEWKDVCELHEMGDDWKELRKVMTRKWEPYTDHVWSLDL